MKCMIVAALLALLTALLAFTVVPGSSVLDLNIDVGMKVFAFLRHVHRLGAADCPAGERLSIGHSRAS